MTAIQIEQIRNPWRPTWELLEAMEAAERIAAGQADDVLVAMPTPPVPAMPPLVEFDDEPKVAAAGGRR